MLDTAKLGQFVGQVWNDSIVPTLVDYIRVPNKSPAFDPDWAAHGHMEAAVAMFERWARDRLTALPGAILEIVRLPGRTPLILIEVPGKGAETVLLYGHLDKQPEMVGWAEGYGPWIPRLEGDKLYGRGDAWGVVPSSFRILRQLLSRLEDDATGAIRPAALYAQIPAERVEQAKRAATALGDSTYSKFPFAPGAGPMADDPTELVLNRT